MRHIVVSYLVSDSLRSAEHYVIDADEADARFICLVPQRTRSVGCYRKLLPAKRSAVIDAFKVVIIMHMILATPHQRQ